MTADARSEAHHTLDEALPKQFLDPLTPVLLPQYQHSPVLDNLDGRLPPTQDEVARIIDETRKLLFPGYFSVPVVELECYLDRQLAAVRALLSTQIACALRSSVEEDADCHQMGVMAAHEFLLAIPLLRQYLEGDIQAAKDGDPAAKTFAEIIYCYPGVKATYIYRIAHQLYLQGVPLIPRLMTEYAHEVTGIDIHPGATIGHNFFIDHGTGVVIGETAVIGNNVRIYQGVTLGALSVPRDSEGQARSVRGKKRHPTIEDNVTIYAEATILGGDTIVGKGSLIGGNVWLTHSVAPGAKVLAETPQLIIRESAFQAPQQDNAPKSS